MELQRNNRLQGYTMTILQEITSLTWLEVFILMFKVFTASFLAYFVVIALLAFLNMVILDPLLKSLAKKRDKND